MKRIKIEIKNRWTGNVLFEYESEGNTDKKTLEEAVKAKENLEGAYLQGAYLEGAYLRGAYLRGAYLEGANLRGAYLQGAYLQGAYLEGAYLEGANLEGAYLEGANLRDANLRGAYLEGANLQGANLEGAYLEGAYIFVLDSPIDVDEVIKQFQEKSGLKIKKWFVNRSVVPTRWNSFWKYGLIIQELGSKEICLSCDAEISNS